MTDQEKEKEIIRSLMFVIEGSDEIYGLIDRPDIHYTSSTDMIDVDKLFKEAKSFLAGDK